MNKQRRKEIAKAVQLIEEAQTIIDAAKDEEQDAHDNLPESMQYSEKGEQMEECISMLEEASGFLSDAETALEEI